MLFRARTRPVVTVPVVAAALLLAACGGGKGAGTTATTTPKGTAAQLLNDGVSAVNAGNDTQARADYQAVIAKDVGNKLGLAKVAWYDLGVLDQRLGQSTNAEAEYQQAVELDPSYTSALYNLATIETTTDPKGAIQLYQQILSIEPDNPNSEFNLGLLLYDNGQIAQGRADLNKAIAAAPSLASRVPSGVSLTGGTSASTSTTS